MLLTHWFEEITLSVFIVFFFFSFLSNDLICALALFCSVLLSKTSPEERKSPLRRPIEICNKRGQNETFPLKKPVEEKTNYLCGSRCERRTSLNILFSFQDSSEDRDIAAIISSDETTASSRVRQDNQASSVKEIQLLQPIFEEWFPVQRERCKSYWLNIRIEDRKNCLFSSLFFLSLFLSFSTFIIFVFFFLTWHCIFMFWEFLSFLSTLNIRNSLIMLLCFSVTH